MAGPSFRKAERAALLVRLLLMGPSGSGKTYTALEIATGLADGGTIGLIDTERSSSLRYGDLFDFDQVDLEDPTVEAYIGMFDAAADASYSVLIIDSISHAWDAVLAFVDEVAARQMSGNRFAGWKEGTPLQKRFLSAILDFPGHVIATARSKQEYVLEEDERGRKIPRKVGLAPVQRDGVEYEFDAIFDLDLSHKAIVTKSRFAPFADRVIPKPDRKLGDELRLWAAGGTGPRPLTKTEVKQLGATIHQRLAPEQVEDLSAWRTAEDIPAPGSGQFNEEHRERILGKVAELIDAAADLAAAESALPAKGAGQRAPGSETVAGGETEGAML